MEIDGRMRGWVIDGAAWKDHGLAVGRSGVFPAQLLTSRKPVNKSIYL